MNRRDPRPSARRSVLLAGVVLLAVGALALALAVHPSRGPSAPAGAAPVGSAPSPVITLPGRPAPPPVPALSAGQLADARAAARMFLASYLPVLYGRAAARHVRGVDAHVRASLRTANRPPRAPANRRPHVTQLVAQPQGAARVLMLATIADGVSPPYRIVFAVTRQPGGWRVSELANY